MNTRIPTYEPNNDSFTSTNLRKGIRQQAGPWREFVLWLLLTGFLLMLLADAAYATEQRSAARTRSTDAGVPTYNIDAICRGAASMAHLLETNAPDNAQNCRADEHSARQQVAQQWTQFDAADRIMCDGAAQSGTVEPTYTELMTCLEVARDNHDRNRTSRPTARPIATADSWCHTCSRSEAHPQRSCWPIGWRKFAYDAWNAALPCHLGCLMFCLEESLRLRRGCEGVRGGDEKIYGYGACFYRRCDCADFERSGPNPTPDSESDTRASVVDVSWRQPARPAAKPDPYRIP